MATEVLTPGIRTESPEWRGLYLIAGLASIAFVLLLITALVIDYSAPPPVHGGAETLQFIAVNKTIYAVEQVLWILPNALAVLVFVALFVALSPINRSLSLIAAILGGMSWGLILAIPVTSRGSLALIYLSDQYVAASPADRNTFAVAAEAIIAENNTPAIVGVLSAAGILLMSIVMTRGGLSRVVAWLGVVTGGLGIVCEALRHAAPQFYWAYGLLLWVWFAAVGVALIRLSRLIPPLNSRHPPLTRS